MFQIFQQQSIAFFQWNLCYVHVKFMYVHDFIPIVYLAVYMYMYVQKHVYMIVHVHVQSTSKMAYITRSSKENKL